MASSINYPTIQDMERVKMRRQIVTYFIQADDKECVLAFAKDHIILDAAIIDKNQIELTILEMQPIVEVTISICNTNDLIDTDKGDHIKTIRDSSNKLHHIFISRRES